MSDRRLAAVCFELCASSIRCGPVAAASRTTMRRQTLAFLGTMPVARRDASFKLTKRFTRPDKTPQNYTKWQNDCNVEQSAPPNPIT